MINLRTTLSDNLTLDDPFMVASSHHSDSDNAFRNLRDFRPSAVTLKTVSLKEGGAGSREPMSRHKVELRYPGGNRLGCFTDGPRMYELWDAPTALHYIQRAGDILPNTKLGLSVREGEDYTAVEESLELASISYVELNWKYSFRTSTFAERASEIAEDLTAFVRVFSQKTVLVKVPNELLPFLSRPEFRDIYKLLFDYDCLLLVANTKRAVVPPSRQPAASTLYDRGVIYGEQLFLDTFNAMLQLTALKEQGWQIPKLVATGGITDIGAIIDVIAAGADAVQLCSILDYRKVKVIDVLRRQLGKLIVESEFESYETFKESLRSPADHRRAWLRTSHRAREMETAHDVVIERIQKNQSMSLTALKETIRNETLTSPNSEIPKRTNLARPEGMRFFINKSNIGAFLISHKIVAENSYVSSTIDNAQALRERLKKDDFDLGIVSKWVVDAINTNSSSTALAPPLRVIGKVGRSIFEVVGTAAQLGDIRTLFHFLGAGSTAALTRLLPMMKPKPMLRQIENVGLDLSPILLYWDDSDAVLARGPLTYFYKLLLGKGTGERWRPMWNVEDELLLVGRTGIDCKDAQLEALLADAQRISYTLHTEPEQGARQAQELGYLNHIANLLGANVLA